MGAVQGGNYIVAVQIGAVKIYVAAVEALRKKNERQGETHESISFTPLEC